MYQYPNFGSAYGSGLYGTNFLNYAPSGFSNQNPNWNQGNYYQYYTGGTGTGLTNPGYGWYRSLRNSPFQGQGGNRPQGILPALIPPRPIGRPGPVNAPGK